MLPAEVCSQSLPMIVALLIMFLAVNEPSPILIDANSAAEVLKMFVPLTIKQLSAP